MDRSLGTKVALAFVALLGMIATACGSSSGGSSSTTAVPAGISVSDPWIRTTPAGATTAAAYMTISSSDGDRLVGASVPSTVAGSAELHHTVDASSTDRGAESSSTMSGSDMGGSDMGQMTMQEVSGIDVPAGGSANLSPGGYHIMLIDLVAPLTSGETVPITLTFEKAGKVVVDATVRDN